MPITEFILKPQIFSLIRPFFHSGFVGRKKIIRKLNITSKEKIIDIACGVGTFSTLITGEYTGVDINSNFIEFAKRKYKKDFFVADATNLKAFNDKSFDKALIIDCIHHLPDDKVKKILQEARRVTKNKILIVETPKEFNSKFLMRIDKGTNFRTTKKLHELVSNYFRIEKMEMFKSGFYKEIAFIGFPKK